MFKLLRFLRISNSLVNSRMKSERKNVLLIFGRLQNERSSNLSSSHSAKDERWFQVVRCPKVVSTPKVVR